MKTRRLLFSLGFMALLVQAVTISSPNPANASPLNSDDDQYHSGTLPPAGGDHHDYPPSDGGGGDIAPLRVWRDPVWDTVTRMDGFISGPRSLNQKSLDAFLRHLGPFLRVNGAHSGWRVREEHQSQSGGTHVVLVRTHRGLDVVGSQLVLHFSEKGHVIGANGRYHPDLLEEVNPSLDAHQAVERAATLAGSPGTRSLPGVRLVFAPDERTGAPRLAWEVPLLPIGRSAGGLHLWRIYVDARTGAEVGRLQTSLGDTPQPAIGYAQHEWGHELVLDVIYYPSNDLYGLLNTVHPAGNLIVSSCGQSECYGSTRAPVSSVTDTFTNQKAASTHDHLTTTLSVFHDLFERRSWNGNGRLLRTHVNFGHRWANAAWVGRPYNLIILGDGNSRHGLPTLTACIDIAAHEFGHGMVQETIDLEYRFQSGALNEHFADWAAVMVDEENRWIMGEGCSTPKPLRDLANPENSSPPIPGHMDDYQNLPNTPEGDYGGVHINMGIPNRALYLAAQDVSLDQISQIWYQVLDARMMTARANFVDFVGAALQSAQDLYPEQPAVRSHIRNAFAAVGLYEEDSTPECPPNSTYQDGRCYCNEGYRPNDDGSACEPITAECPPNSTREGDHCYCDPGYAPNSQSNGCDPLPNLGCPENSTRVEDGCRCDEGFTVNDRGDACVPISAPPLECPPNSSDDGEGNCVCDPGYQAEAGGGCSLVEEAHPDCGSETPLGRCEGTVLIYCDEVSDAEAPTIVNRDCSLEGKVCAASAEELGHLCVAPAEGGCPPNSTPRESDDHCICDEGYAPNQDGTGCIAIGSNPSRCPMNSTRQPDGSCLCDEGYKPDELTASHCEPEEGCPENSLYDPQIGMCRCRNGFQHDPVRNICVPPGVDQAVSDGCGCQTIGGGKGSVPGPASLVAFTLLAMVMGLRRRRRRRSEILN